MAVISCCSVSTLILGPSPLDNGCHMREDVAIDEPLWLALAGWAGREENRQRVPVLSGLLTGPLPAHREMPLLGCLHADLLAVEAGSLDAPAREALDTLSRAVARAVARAGQLDQPGQRVIGLAFFRREPPRNDEAFRLSFERFIQSKRAGPPGSPQDVAGA